MVAPKKGRGLRYKPLAIFSKEKGKKECFNVGRFKSYSQKFGVPAKHGSLGVSMGLYPGQLHVTDILHKC